MIIVKRIGEEEDDVFDCTVDLPPAVIPGEDYEADFVRAEVKKHWDGTSVAKIFLHFSVRFARHEPAFPLYMACNGPRAKKWPMSSKYTRAWILAAGHKPMRTDRLSPRVFEGKRFKVRVRLVTHNSQRQPLAIEQQYSVIDEVLACLGPIPATAMPSNPMVEHAKPSDETGSGVG